MSSEEASEIIEKEPLLKYKRLKGDLEMICVSNVLTCAAFHVNYYAIGTSEGKVILLDNNDKIIRTFDDHKSRITAIDFDRTGQYIISGSQEGQVCLSTILGLEKTIQHYNSPITGLSLDDNISIKRDNCYIVSTLSGQLIQTRKTFMGTKVRKLGDPSKQAVYSIARNRNILAYAYEGGVELYLIDSNTNINSVQRYSDCPDTDYVLPQLYWKDENVLLVGWGEVIKVIKITYSFSPDKAHTVSCTAEVSSYSRFNFWINGLGSIDDQDYLLISYPSYTPEEGKAPEDEPPQTFITSFDNHKISEGNTLDGEAFTDHYATDYFVTHSTSYNATHTTEGHPVGYYYTYIIAPKCILRIHRRTILDHLQWLEDHHLYQEALQFCSEADHHFCSSQVTTIQSDHLNYLFENKDYEETAKYIQQYITSTEGWLQWIFRFLPLGQLDVLVPYLPLQSPRLNNETYTFILLSLLQNNPPLFLSLLRTWPYELPDSTTLYDLTKIQVALNEMKPITDPSLIEAQVEISLRLKEYEKAISLFLDSNMEYPGTDLLTIIQKYDLYSTVENKIESLMHYAPEKVADLLTRHTDDISPRCVYEQLKDSPPFLVIYLNSLLINNTTVYNNTSYGFVKNEKIQADHLHLIVDYTPDVLLYYLRDARYCNFEEAKRLCEAHDPPLYKDLVFLLTRVGNSQAALEMCVNQIKDAKYCIEYVKNNNQINLWEDLVNLAYNQPEFVAELLDNITEHIDPLILLKKIPDELEIPELKNRLKRILEKYSLEIDLSESCVDILLYDLTTLVGQFISLKHRGILINPNDVCPICEQTLFQVSIEHRRLVYKDITAFPCKHIYHHDCLSNFPSLLYFDEEHDDYLYKCYMCDKPEEETD